MTNLPNSTSRASLNKLAEKFGRDLAKGADSIFDLAYAVVDCAHTGNVTADTPGAMAEAYILYLQGRNAVVKQDDQIETDPAKNKSIAAQASKLGSFAKVAVLPFIPRDFYNDKIEQNGDVEPGFASRVKKVKGDTGLYTALVKANVAQKERTRIMTDEELAALFVKEQKAPETEEQFLARIAKSVQDWCKNHGVDEGFAKIGAAIKSKQNEGIEQRALRDLADVRKAKDEAAAAEGKTVDHTAGLRLIEPEQQLIAAFQPQA